MLIAAGCLFVVRVAPNQFQKVATAGVGSHRKDNLRVPEAPFLNLVDIELQVGSAEEGVEATFTLKGRTGNGMFWASMETLPPSA